MEENRVLNEQLGGKVPRLNDDQRRRLAAKAKILGRRALDAVASIVTPDTLLRWHQRLIGFAISLADNTDEDIGVTNLPQAHV